MTEPESEELEDWLRLDSRPEQIVISGSGELNIGMQAEDLFEDELSIGEFLEPFFRLR